MEIDWQSRTALAVREVVQTKGIAAGVEALVSLIYHPLVAGV